MTAMADLNHGTRVRHVTWGDEGTILTSGQLVTPVRVRVKFDGMSPPVEVCPGGYIEPGDLEIIKEASWTPPR